MPPKTRRPKQAPSRAARNKPLRKAKAAAQYLQKHAEQYAEATPTLEGLPEKIQLMIIAHLVVTKTPIELDPCAPPPTGIAAGNMNIARISDNFHALTMLAFYGQNHFVLLPNETADLPGPIHQKWIHLAHQVPTPLSIESSLDCLSLLAQTPGCLAYTRTLTAHLGAHGITTIYQDFFTTLITRLPLRTLTFVLVRDWARVLERSFGRGFMDEGEKEILYPRFVEGVMGVVGQCFGRVERVFVRRGVVVGGRGRGRRRRVLTGEERVLERLGVALEVRNREWVGEGVEVGEEEMGDSD